MLSCNIKCHFVYSFSAHTEWRGFSPELRRCGPQSDEPATTAQHRPGCRGRGDGVLTVRDGGSAPVTFAPRSSLIPLPLHPALPPSRPARDPQQPKTPQTRHWWAQERTPGGGGREGEETPGGGCLALPQPFPPPTPPHTSWHTITWDALKCFTVGWSLGSKAVSENTHRLCGWISNVVFFSFFLWVGWFCFVLFCLCWDFRQCYVLYLLWSLEEFDQSAADWSKEKYSFGQAASVMIDRVRGEILNYFFLP